ncbi:hypothetical protein Leryth_020931 [Lithospermum erythrorhizon]|nr:hypothetical protein Leryth_020931 [Lithospermum erythrorhizon]
MGKKSKAKRRESMKIKQEYPYSSTNILLDRAVSKVYPSIVAITNYTGDEEQMRIGLAVNGVIFSCISQGDNAQFVCYILTSADLD